MKIYCVKEFVFLSGLAVVFTYDDLSIRKVATQSTTAAGNLYKADNAVDRNITTCMRTEMIGSYSSDQTVWWKVDLGGVYNIYSVNILFKNYDGYETRQKGRFAGFSLFVSDNGEMEGSSLCYKDGPQLPPLNFTTMCTLSGRYVIFYNERLAGVTYPEGYELNNVVFMELCEVIVNGCSKPGVYGSNCNVSCPINCTQNTCHILNGTCFGCEPGWTGTRCITKCAFGWYGLDCKENCSGHCRDNVSCNHVTGQCDGGCAAGWRGSFCAIECVNGTFGYKCVNTCSGHCLNEAPCEKQTGYCDGGCKPGYTNNFCSEKCPSGYFGNGCRKKCSEHCFNNEVCDHVDGVCTSGCQDGYIEKWCNTTCIEGYYGPNCSRTCSINCKTCKPTDGTCSCRAGWKGTNCGNSCYKSYGENCQFPCSPLCRNQTCDRYNDTCLPDEIHVKTLNFSRTNKEENTCTVGISAVGMSVSLGFNAIFIIAALFLLRKHYSKMHLGMFQSCWESPLYEKSKGVTEQEQTYQDLNLQDNHQTYQEINLQNIPNHNAT